MAANKDLNRLKVVLVEKKKSSLWLSRHCDVRQQRYQNGVPTLVSLRWKRIYE